MGDIANVGVPRVRVPGDSADDSEEVTVSSLPTGCDDGETSGDIPSDEEIACMMSHSLMTVPDINHKEQSSKMTGLSELPIAEDELCSNQSK